MASAKCPTGYHCMKVYGMAFERPGDRRSLGAMADIRGSGSPARKRPRSGQA